MKYNHNKQYDNILPWLNHFAALRLLLIQCIVALLLGSMVVGIFFPHFSDLLNQPLRQSTGIYSRLPQGLVTTGPMEIFSVFIQICFSGGLTLSIPWMFYFTGKFMKPGLTEHERIIFIIGCLSMLILFSLGVAFSYFFVIPASLDIAIYFNQMLGFQLLWSAPHYYTLIIGMTLGVGLCFEFPLMMTLLVFFNIITTSQLSGWRRHAIVFILISAALITPGGDPLTLIILSVPMYVLYEFTLIACKVLERYSGTKN